MFTRNQLEEGAFGIGVGDNDAAADLRTVCKGDAADCPVLNDDVVDCRIGLQGCPAGPCGRSHRLCDAAHPALDDANIFGLGKVVAFDIGVSPRTPRRGEVAGILGLGIRSPASSLTQRTRSVGLSCSR